MEFTTIFMAWPYANGPLHLGHVAGNSLPADIQYKYERAMGRRVLMLSGSDEHGTPITVTAEEKGISPQDVVDEFHNVNSKALADLGCSWNDNIDPRGVEFGGALYNRTTDPRHKEIVQEVFLELYNTGLLDKQTMQQYCEINENNQVKFLPDRYVLGTCPNCGNPDARGDQCDSCGSTYEAHELKTPRSKSNPDAAIEIRDTEHLFYRLDIFQSDLENHSSDRKSVWKPNVKAMTKNWLNMGLRPRAITRDLEWGIEVPINDKEWENKRIYVWFEAVQGYYTTARIWAEKFAKEHPEANNAWENWWIQKDNHDLKHIYFMGKDNIPFHTIIWPAILMGLNKSRDTEKQLHLEDNVAANEYLMLQGGQFSKSRKHGVWLPAFLERYDPDTLRYYLTINMPEGHDTDFRWEDYVERVNNELIGNYGNFVHRVLTLTNRLTNLGNNPLIEFDNEDDHYKFYELISRSISSAIESMERQRFKEALRHIMNISQAGNSYLQQAEPWAYMNLDDSVERNRSLSALCACWRACQALAILTYPFMPFQAEKLWLQLGESGKPSEQLWRSAADLDRPLNWSGNKPVALFTKLDIDEILKRESALAEPQTEEVDYIEFEDFMKVEMKTGTILSVENHPNADKLYVVTIEDGPESTRTVCAGLKSYYSVEDLVGKSVVFVANLKPRKLRGIMSEGMMLAAEDSEGNVTLLTTDGDIVPGSGVR
jgi:methionyl-tRNA synthetase|tara:strand:- start:12207 stop:14345 length:2139 start_codon:yes stop_codon:yes gene_type:complete